MITPYGQECTYYYQDVHRGRSTQECRLLQHRLQQERWQYSLCKSCPVPGILRANACSNMMLEGRIVRHLLFWRQMEISAFCLETLEAVENPYVGCGRCHLHRSGAEALLGELEGIATAESRESSSGSDRDSP